MSLRRKPFYRTIFCGGLRCALPPLLLFLGIVIVYAYYAVPPWWGKNFGLVDNLYYYGPNTYFLDACLQNGEFPLWNPLSYGGLPFAADPQSNAWYPLHLLRSVLTPPFNPYVTAISMQLMLLLHLMIAGMGAYVLARAYACSRPAAMAAAFAFMLNPYSIVYFTEFYVFPLVIAWIPWVLWAAFQTLRATSAGNACIYAILTLLFFSMSTLAGFPQLSLYMGLMLGFYVLLDLVFHSHYSFLRHCGDVEGEYGPVGISLNCPWDRGSMRRALRRFAGRSAFLVLIMALVMLVCAVMFLPSIQFGRNSARVAAAGLEVKSSWGQNLEWGHLLKCLVIFPGNTWLPQGCRAAGIVSLALVFTALLCRPTRNMLVFSALYLVMTDFTLGPPFPLGALLHRIDILNITVSPWRAGCFASIGFAMLIGFSVDTLAERASRKSSRLARSLVMLLAATILLMILLNWLRDNPLNHPWFLVWLVPMVAPGLVLLFFWRNAPRLGRSCLALLVMAEILVWAAQMLPAYVDPRAQRQVVTRGFGKNRTIPTDNRRGAYLRPNWHMWTLNFSTLGYNPLYVGATRTVLCHPQHENIYRGTLKAEDAVVENQRGNLMMKRNFWLAREWVHGPLPGKAEVFPVATTVFLPDPPDSPLFPPSPDYARRAVSDDTERIVLDTGESLRNRAQKAGDGTMTLRLPPLKQNKAHCVLYVGYTATNLVDFRPVSLDENGIIHRLKRTRATATQGREKFLEIPLPDLETNHIILKWPQETAHRIQLTQAYVLKDKSDEDARIVIKQYTANTVLLEVREIPGPRILLFLDSYYPGWKAWVDGVPADILRANDAFKAVFVPSGTHRVKFEYRPTLTWIGAAISGSTVLALLSVLVGLSGFKIFSSISKQTGLQRKPIALIVDSEK